MPLANTMGRPFGWWGVDQLSFEAAGACSGATVELDFQSNGGAWASDQILVLESPSGQGCN